MHFVVTKYEFILKMAHVTSFSNQKLFKGLCFDVPRKIEKSANFREDLIVFVISGIFLLVFFSFILACIFLSVNKLARTSKSVELSFFITVTYVTFKINGSYMHASFWRIYIATKIQKTIK